MVHPGCEATLVAIRVPILEHTLKRGLDYVLRRRRVPRQFDEKAEKPPVMAVEQFSERVQIAVANGEHQLVIGGGSGAVHRVG
jgi:hypothetical protein